MDDLFARWRKARPEYDKFNDDGIINEECWNRVEPSKRILFILKETNNLEGSLTDFLREGGSPTYYRTWNNIARWTEIIISGTYFDKMNRQQLHDSLQLIAVMNVKKQAGAARAKRKKIFEAADKDSEFIQEEIREIDAGIIVTCGFEVVSECLHNHIFKEQKDNWIRDDETGLWYYFSDIIRKKKKTVVISMPHPNRAEKEYTHKLKNLIQRVYIEDT